MSWHSLALFYGVRWLDGQEFPGHTLEMRSFDLEAASVVRRGNFKVKGLVKGLKMSPDWHRNLEVGHQAPWPMCETACRADNLSQWARVHMRHNNSDLPRLAPQGMEARQTDFLEQRAKDRSLVSWRRPSQFWRKKKLLQATCYLES